MFDTFYEDYFEFKDYMNEITKTITPTSKLVTNLSNDNVYLQTKRKLLEEKNKGLKNENSNLKGNIIKIGLNGKNSGVDAITSIFVMKNPNLNVLIRRVINLLHDL